MPARSQQDTTTHTDHKVDVAKKAAQVPIVSEEDSIPEEKAGKPQHSGERAFLRQCQNKLVQCHTVWASQVKDKKRLDSVGGERLSNLIKFL